MSGRERRSGIHPAAEAALALLASAGLFLLTAAIPIRGHLVPIFILGAVYVWIVVVAARRWGPLYAVPLAIAGGLGFDSFYIPPTREFGADDWQNWLVVAIYISMALLIGMIGARSQRRAEKSEQARGLIADEQAALRRVATLVARGVPPEELFAAVVDEVRRVLPVEVAAMGRYGSDDAFTNVATSGPVGDRFPVGGRWSLGGRNVGTLVFETGRPARIDSYADASDALGLALHERGFRSSVGAPILVEGRLWGVMTASSCVDQSLPADTEARLVAFTGLVATAISNAEARVELARLADEQAALRRVATLVAEGAHPTAVFEAVVAEVAGVCDAELVMANRYEGDGTVTVLALWGPHAEVVPGGARVRLEGESVTAAVLRSGRTTRIDNMEGATGRIARMGREMGIRAAVGAPLVVEGRLWGSIVASWTGEEPPPSDAEERMAQFAELVDTAIANADSRTQLTASRARVLVAADDARRRVVRDLHDGAQQRLIHTIVTLKLAQRAFKEKNGKAESLVAEALAHAQQGNAELRELAHGILPTVLTRGGLRAGVDALVSRVDLPVTVDIPAQRFPAGIESSAYFTVAEALTNVIKHSRADSAEIRVVVDEGILKVEVRDDGIGGAERGGTGLVGIDDRVTALGGWLRVQSPAGGGTVVAAAIPLLA